MDSCSSKEHYRPSVYDEHDMLPNLWFRLSGTRYHLTLTVLCLYPCFLLCHVQVTYRLAQAQLHTCLCRFDEITSR